MVTRRGSVAMLVLAALIATGAAAQTHSPEEIAAHRREILDSFFAPDGADSAMRERRLCFLGKQPEKVAKDRAEGAYFMPDPADTCVAVLTRAGLDRQLISPYSELVESIGGDMAIVGTLPQAMGAATMAGQSTVPIGNGKGARVDAAIAFDAGFTVAFQEKAATPAGGVNDAQLKAVTAACLGTRQDGSTCYSVGYLQGARAYQQHAAPRR